MSAGRVLALALGTQSLLIVAAWAASRALAVPPQWGDPVRDTLIGLAAAAALGVINHALLVHAPANWLTRGIRAIYDDLLVPLFGRLNGAGIVLIGIAAGLGEEWLFRGVLQPLVGLFAASVLFGLAHVGGRRMLPFGVWAAVMGVALGVLAIVTGGLIAPAVAHGAYDMLALAYIRRGAHKRET